MAVFLGELGEMLQRTEQAIPDYEFRKTRTNMESWHQMGDQFGLVGFAIEIGCHIENQTIAWPVRHEQFPTQKFAGCPTSFDQSLGHPLETLAVKDDDFHAVKRCRNAVSDNLGEESGETVGDVAEEGFAQTGGNAAEFAVEGFVAGVVLLPVSSQVCLATRSVMFDEGIKDPVDELWEGNNVLVASAAMSLEKFREEGGVDAVGEKCE